MFTTVGQGFANQYYQWMADPSTRVNLNVLYRDNSLMTWTGTQMQGVGPIMERFGSLQFGKCAFNLKSDDIDCHPSVSGGVIVVVNSEVHLEGEARPLKFSDVFHLATDQAGQWYVTNHLFKIVGGG